MFHGLSGRASIGPHLGGVVRTGIMAAALNEHQTSLVNNIGALWQMWPAISPCAPNEDRPIFGPVRLPHPFVIPFTVNGMTRSQFFRIL
jgi:hypothetical protein